MRSEMKDFSIKIPKDLEKAICEKSQTFLVTGGAGFIGSNIIECLLNMNQKVITLDNFSTGKRENLEQVRKQVGEKKWIRHRLIEGDISNTDDCFKACEDVDIILHQAALGSVPRSIVNPLATHNANATGFLNMLIAAKDAGINRFVYAASSSTYGDSVTLPKEESIIGHPLSPYAVTKYLNELYSSVFSSCYGLETVGLRYFNVFGPRQDPNGAYAAVIPRWIGAMLSGQRCTIFGDGSTSRDFCFIGNAVQANLRAAITQDSQALNQVYNVAYGAQTSLNQLHHLLKQNLNELVEGINIEEPIYDDFRKGDVLHSLANIDKAKRKLSYKELCSLENGLKLTAEWFVNLSRQRHNIP